MNYEKYKKMIYSRAWYYTKKYNCIDHIEDIIAQGNFIYSHALTKYKPNKGSFSTYLFWRLNKLKDYIEKYILHPPMIQIEKITIKENSFEKFKIILEFYDIANTELSNEARMVMDYILQGWVGRKPGYNTVKRWFCKYYNYPVKIIDAAWNEIKEFWKNYNISGDTVLKIYNISIRGKTEIC